MSEPCPWCPFSDCPCPWQGGVNPAAAEADRRAKECDTLALTWENWSGNDERPTASTADRSSHSDSTKTKGGRTEMVPTPNPQCHQYDQGSAVN